MTTARNAPDQAILLVSESDDDAAARLISVLTGLGLRVDRSANVYDAMARIARGTAYLRVLLDYRTLDDKEAAFARLVRRYFPSSEIIAPDLPGTKERLALLGLVVRLTSIGAIVDSLCPIAAPLASPSADGRSSPTQPAFPTQPVQPHPPLSPLPEEPPAVESDPDACDDTDPEPPHAEPAEFDLDPADQDFHSPAQPESPAFRDPSPAHPHLEPASSLPPQPPALSTAGGRTAPTDEPSLHEAVRMRMAGNDPRLIRRPPPRAPSQNPPPADDRSAPASSTDSDSLSPNNFDPFMPPPTTQPSDPDDYGELENPP